MSEILKTACQWHRSLRWQISPGNVSAAAEYHPGRISVLYQMPDDGPARVKRVLLYSEKENPRKRKRPEVLTEIPAHLHNKVARIVRDNERSYGRIIVSVLLPSGETAYVYD